MAEKNVRQKNLEIEGLKGDGKVAEKALHENMEAQQARAEHARNYDKMVAELEARLRREREEREKVIQENMKLTVQLRSTERELTDSKNSIRKLELELTGKDDTIYCLNENLRNRDEVAWHRDELLSQLKAFRNEHASLLHSVDTVKQDFRSQNEKQNLFFDRSAKQRSELDSRVAALEAQLRSRDERIASMQQDILAEKAQVTTLEQLLCVKEDLASKLDQMNELTEELAREKEKLQADLEVTADYLIEQEEKTAAANKSSQQLVGQLQEKESEILQYQD